MIRKNHWMAFFLAAALTALPVFGQDPEEQPLRVETDLVNITVSVTDKNGDFVTGLERINFVVYDDGVRQQIEYFSAAENEPISYGIVYDMHPTTAERTRAVLESLRQFAKTLGERDDLFTLVFTRRGSLVTDFVPTAEQVDIHLGDGRRGPNALYDGIYLAAERIRRSRNLKRVLLVITDSADHQSEHRFGDILDQFRTLDARIYAVLWDEAEQWQYQDITAAEGADERRRRLSSDASGLDRAALQELALRTGGTMQSPTVQNADQLYRIYRRIARETGRQYLLGFYPTRPDERPHALRIDLRLVKNRRKMIMTYRPGYQRIRPK